MRKLAFLAVVLVAFSGCYHATVETGLAPGNQTLERRWAHGWIAGLVPPSTVETMERCPDGVARVETKLSFLNQLVGALTLSIYTPMSIVVTCAAGEEEDSDLVDNAADFRKGLDSGEAFWVKVG